MLDEGYVNTYPLDQAILLIGQVQVEPLATMVLAGLLIAGGKQAQSSP